VFRDRRDAGERLAAVLASEIGHADVVLGIPRGGVVVAAPVAAALGARLDVVVPRKLGAPGNPELGIGAVAPGVVVVDDALVARLHVADSYLEREIRAQEAEIERRLAVYRADREPPELERASVVLVDDGVATGATSVAALRWARKAGAAKVVFAAPVGPAGIERVLAPECDACVILETPASFSAVGEWYERFGQISDEQVREELGAS
jgi:putative phosphoribosyl transferase